MEYTYRPEASAAVFLDGITTAVIKGFTPDISWRDFYTQLGERRPELQVEYLQQPHDWREILSGEAVSYSELVGQMCHDGTCGFHADTEFVAVFGYSLGGLSALRVAHAIAGMEHLNLKYLALVTMGTPFAGTGRLLDSIIRNIKIDYLQLMLDEDENRRLLEDLVLDSAPRRCRVLIGEIERDEMVSASSALAPAHWLSALSNGGDFKWGTVRIPSGKLLRTHDGLLHDTTAVAFINGLLDGLLPPD